MTEQELFKSLSRTWAARAANLGLVPDSESRAQDFAAFMTGVLATAWVTGVLTEQRMNGIAFITLVRGEKVLDHLTVRGQCDQPSQEV